MLKTPLPLRPASQLLRLGWWNTKLAHPSFKPIPSSSKTVKQRASARQVVLALLEDEQIDLLALGELSQDDLREFIPAHGVGLHIKDIPPTGSGEDLISIGILYNDRKLNLQNKKHWRSTIATGEAGLNLATEFSVYGSADRLYVYAVHWPSRRFDQKGERRNMVAQALRSEINIKLCEQDSHIVLLGDFNDEPFDNSVNTALISSRDRQWVRARPEILYNPCWRLLGERQDLSDEDAGPICAGTHFFTSPLTRWHTVDQVLVSSSLLGGREWRLREQEIRIWHPPFMRSRFGRISGGSDHLPILCGLERITPTTLDRRTK